MTEQLLTETSSSFDNLIAGDQIQPITKEFTLLSGENLIRGTLLGKITASGKLVESDTVSIDGSEVPYAVLTKDTDATAGDTKTLAYVAGIFNSNVMTFGGAHTAASTYDALRALSIFLTENAVPSGD